LRSGARALPAQAVEAEVTALSRNAKEEFTDEVIEKSLTSGDGARTDQPGQSDDVH
jgi:hypothetical protein